VPALVERISPLLAGRDPGVQGGALADLVAMYFAGHMAEIREEIIALWIEAMRKLIPVNEAIILERHGGKWPGVQ
jgi:hypothetical protein